MAYKVFINPLSGKYSPQVEERIKEALDGSDFSIEYTSAAPDSRIPGLRRTGTPSDLESLVSLALTEGFTELVLVGGDGTVHDAVNAIMASGRDTSGISLFVIPTGSGDDFSGAALGLRTDEDAIRALESYRRSGHGSHIDADVFRVDGDGFSRYAINLADASYGAHLASWVANHGTLKKMFGGNIYSVGLFLSFWSYRHTSFDLYLDGQHAGLYRGNFLANVLNSTDAGGGLYLCEKASPDDGTLDLIMADGMRLPPAGLLLKARSRKTILDDRRVRYHTGFREARLSAHDSDLGRFLEIDGEVFEAEKPIKEITYAHSGRTLRFITG